MTSLQAKLQTTSNFRNLNGTWVNVIQFLGTIVYVKAIDPETDTDICFDVSLSEISEIIQAI